MLLKKVYIVHAMSRIALVDSCSLVTSQASVRLSDLTGCWHLFTHKGTFCVDSLVNHLAGGRLLGPAYCLAQNFLHGMMRTLCTFLKIIIHVCPIFQLFKAFLSLFSMQTCFSSFILNVHNIMYWVSQKNARRLI